MFYKRSNHALNKATAQKIIYSSLKDGTISLSKDDFSSRQSFKRWKHWSDRNYHQEDNLDVSYAKHNLPLEEFSRTAFADQSPEDLLIGREAAHELEQLKIKALKIIRSATTSMQYRRLFMYYGEGMTLMDIAKIENVSFQQIHRSINRGQKNVAKFLEKRVKK